MLVCILVCILVYLGNLKKIQKEGAKDIFVVIKIWMFKTK